MDCPHMATVCPHDVGLCGRIRAIKTLEPSPENRYASAVFGGGGCKEPSIESERIKVMRDTFYTKHWEGRRRANVHIQNEGRIEVLCVGGRIQVVTPYHPHWVTTAHALSGRWRRKTLMWTFPAKELESILRAIAAIFPEVTPTVRTVAKV
jgi:hypothetical protein